MMLDTHARDVLRQLLGIQRLDGGSLELKSPLSQGDEAQVWIDYLWIADIDSYFRIGPTVSVVGYRSRHDADEQYLLGTVFTPEFLHQGKLQTAQTVCRLAAGQDRLIDLLQSVNLIPKLKHLTFAHDLGFAGLHIWTYVDGGYASIAISNGRQAEGEDGRMLLAAVETCRTIVELGDDALLKLIVTTREHGE